jgi:hypothetical protein
MTTKAKRSKSQLARDRLKISEMYLAGKIQWEIATELKLNQCTVSRDLVEIQKEWKIRAGKQIDLIKAQELSKIDQLERTYWEAWERSCVEGRRHTTKMRGTITRELNEPNAERRFVQETPTEQIVTTIELIGDKRFLEGVQWCIERRCKMLGLDTEVDVDHDVYLHIVRDTKERKNNEQLLDSPTYFISGTGSNILEQSQEESNQSR